MIDGGTQLGLSEVGSDARTKDFNEVGDVLPQIKALSAVNPNSALIPVTRISGVTTVVSLPEGDLIPGTAALINLYGYTPEQMYAGFEGVVLTFPNTGRKGFFDRRTEDEIKKAAENALKKLNEVWDMAVQYYKLDSATKSKGVGYYPEMQALLPVIKGERSLNDKGQCFERHSGGVEVGCRKESKKSNLHWSRRRAGVLPTRLQKLEFRLLQVRCFRYQPATMTDTTRLMLTLD